MSASWMHDIPRSTRPHGVDRSRRHRLTLNLTGVELHDGALYLRYELSPVPDELVGDTATHDGSVAGIAMDDQRRVFDDCSSAYRRSRDGGHIDLAILFLPLAHTPALHAHLCEVRLRIEDGQATVRSVRVA